MPIHILTFTPGIEFNESLQLGDIVYHCPTGDVGGFDTADTIGGTNDSQIVRIGELVQIDKIAPIGMGSGATTISRLHCDFIMFSKDNKANLSSILGYYAEVELRNDSTTEAELFSVGSEISMSSK